MPVSFIILGVLIIFSIFFIKHKLIKCAVILFSLIIMFGYFYGNLTFDSITVNLFFVLCPFVIALVTLFKLPNDKTNIVCLALVSALLYVAIAKFNSDYITLLNPIPALVVIVVLSITQINKPLNIICFYCLSLTLINICNLILERPLGGIVLGDLNLFNAILLCMFAVVGFSLILKKIQVRRRSV